MNPRLAWLPVLTANLGACGLNTFGVFTAAEPVDSTGAIETPTADTSTAIATHESSPTSGGQVTITASTSSSGQGSLTSASETISDDSTTELGSTEASSTTGAPSPTCPPAEGIILDAVSWSNPGVEVLQSLALTPAMELFLSHYVGHKCGDGTLIDLGEPLPFKDGVTPVFSKRTLALEHEDTWTFTSGDPATILEISVDGSGDLYMLGYYKGHLDIPLQLGTDDPQKKILPGDANYRGFLAVFRADGELRWASSDYLTGSGDVNPVGLGLTDDGGIIVGGYYQHNLDFALCPPTDTDVPNGFISRYSVSQEVFVLDWTACTTPLTSDATAYFQGVTATPDGRVIGAGGFRGSVAFGPMDDPEQSNQGTDDAVLIALTADGEYLWHDIRSSAAEEAFFAVARSPAAQILVAGGDSGDDTTPVHAPAVVASFAVTDDGPVWHFTKELELRDMLARSNFQRVAASPCGEVLAVGYGVGLARWVDDPGFAFVGSAQAKEDVLAVKLTSAGEPLWGLQFGSTTRDWGAALAIDADEHVYIGGAFTSTVSLPNGVEFVAPTGCDTDVRDAFLLRLSP